jgi:signal transduction histidine kinase
MDDTPMNETVLDGLRKSLASLNAGDDATLLEPLLSELWAARNLDAPAASTPITSVEPLGPAFLDKGVAPSRAVRAVLTSGRALIEEGEHDGELDAAGARRLGALIDEAAVRVAQAVEQARRVKRQQWLSYLVHELKNPLNTVLNALWLLREKGQDPKQAARFLELAERAVKRLESRCKDVRELDEELVTPPPGWEPPQPRP